jgi:hypothetical protein
VLVLKTLGGVRRRRRARPRRAAPNPEPTALSVGRATLIYAKPLQVEPEQWLKSVDVEEELLTGLAVINRVLQVQRIVAADPAAHGVTASQAVVMRVGTGLGEQVADGRWESALELSTATPRQRREAILSPQERLAAVLSGRDVILACEELALRARSDIEAGRWREAAFQLDSALRCSVAELTAWAGQGDIDERITELQTAAPPLAESAQTALLGGLSDQQVAAMTQTLERLEAALRARAAIARY